MTPKKQDGLVLVMTLILLVAMTLIGVGLTRVTDTAIQVANNISFKQATLSAADSGIEQAIDTLRNAVTDKLHDSPGNGYYATDQEGTDMTGTQTLGATGDDVDWTGETDATTRAKRGTAVDGTRVAYVIHRMCAKPGSMNTGDDGLANVCATSSSSTAAGGPQSGPDYANRGISGRAQIYYRITVRTEGARNTVSYVQSMVLLDY
jgi:type IV pilus assembly protein PilX